MGKILIGQCHVKDIQVEGTVPQVTCELSQGISALYASDFLSIKWEFQSLPPRVSMRLQQNSYKILGAQQVFGKC
jgi:hypothetical protein